MPSISAVGQTSELAQAIIQRFDTNKDGALGAAEFASVLGTLLGSATSAAGVTSQTGTAATLPSTVQVSTPTGVITLPAGTDDAGSSPGFAGIDGGTTKDDPTSPVGLEPPGTNMPTLPTPTASSWLSQMAARVLSEAAGLTPTAGNPATAATTTGTTATTADTTTARTRVGVMASFSDEKLADPTHTSFKYQIGRILQYYPNTPEGLKAALPEIQKLVPEAKIVGTNGDKLDFGSYVDRKSGKIGVVDVLHAAGRGGESWGWRPVSESTATVTPVVPNRASVTIGIGRA